MLKNCTEECKRLHDGLEQVINLNKLNKCHEYCILVPKWDNSQTIIRVPINWSCNNNVLPGEVYCPATIVVIWFLPLG